MQSKGTQSQAPQRPGTSQDRRQQPNPVKDPGKAPVAAPEPPPLTRQEAMALLRDQERQIKKLNGDLVAVRGERDTLGREVGRLRDTLTAARQSSAPLAGRAQHLQRQLGDRQGRVGELKREAVRWESLANQRLTEINRLQARISERDGETSKRIAERQAELQHWRDRFQQTDQALAEIRPHDGRLLIPEVGDLVPGLDGPTCYLLPVRPLQNLAVVDVYTGLIHEFSTRAGQIGVRLPYSLRLADPTLPIPAPFHVEAGFLAVGLRSQGENLLVRLADGSTRDLGVVVGDNQGPVAESLIGMAREALTSIAGKEDQVEWIDRVCNHFDAVWFTRNPLVDPLDGWTVRLAAGDEDQHAWSATAGTPSLAVISLRASLRDAPDYTEHVDVPPPVETLLRHRTLDPIALVGFAADGGQVVVRLVDGREVAVQAADLDAAQIQGAARLTTSRLVTAITAFLRRAWREHARPDSALTYLRKVMAGGGIQNPRMLWFGPTTPEQSQPAIWRVEAEVVVGEKVRRLGGAAEQLGVALHALAISAAEARGDTWPSSPAPVERSPEVEAVVRQETDPDPPVSDPEQ